MKNDRRQQFLAQLQQKMGYVFVQSALLERALTHRSHKGANNERLEFIGDSILDYVVARMLYDAFPDLPEGRLSPLRAQLVKEATLAQVARELGVGSALLLGVGELKSGGHDRDSILADALEALFAAIALDRHFSAAEEVIRRLFSPKIKMLDPNDTGKDAKTQLQEWLQARKYSLPKYRIEQQMGEGNHAVFEVSCDLLEVGKIFYATGHNRRVAEQDCAQQALAWLNRDFGRA